MLRLIVGIILAFWLLGLLLRLFGFFVHFAFGLFHILVVIAIILFVIDLLMGSRNKV